MIYFNFLFLIPFVIIQWYFFEKEKDNKNKDKNKHEEDNRVRLSASPHRDKNWAVIVDNEKAFEADKSAYGTREAYARARKGEYNM